MSDNVETKVESFAEDLLELLPKPEKAKEWLSYEHFKNRGEYRARYYASNLVGSTALTTLAVTGNTLYAVPFWSGKGGILLNVALSVTATVASSTSRICVYDSAKGETYPSNVLAEIGSFATSTAEPLITARIKVPENKLLHFGVWTSNHTPTLRAIPRAGAYPVHGFPQPTPGANAGIGISTSLTFSSTNPFPVVFPDGGTYLTTSTPAVFYQWEK